MCAVSVIGDYGMQRDWKFQENPRIDWSLFGTKPTPIDWSNPLVREHYQALIDAAKKFDEVAGEPDCPSDDKKEWMTEHGFYY